MAGPDRARAELRRTIHAGLCRPYASMSWMPAPDRVQGKLSGGMTFVGAMR